jgi:pantetheine-phosphate adenylyltransferase
MPSLAILPGTFDPITMGHIDLAERALKVFDKIIIAVGINPFKVTLFTPEERIDMIKKSLTEHNDRIIVDTFDGLLVEYAAKVKAKAIIRGLRAVSDFEYELQLALMNRKLDRNLETFFIITNYRYLYVSSNIIKATAMAGGSVQDLVTDYVAEKLREKFKDGYRDKEK